MERKGNGNSYYMLWSGKTNLSEAGELVWVGHRAGIMGRQGSWKTFLTQNMPQREVQKKPLKGKQKIIKWSEMTRMNFPNATVFFQ